MKDSNPVIETNILDEKSFLKEFRLMLKQAITKFNEKEGNQNNYSGIISKLFSIIENSENAVILRQAIDGEMVYIPKKIWAFLPFVNDLYTAIEKVLKNPEYSLFKCFIETNRDLYAKNKLMERENILIKKQLSELQANQFNPEFVEKIKQQQSEIEIYKQQAFEQARQHEDVIQILTLEKVALEEANHAQEKLINALQKELANAKKSNSDLSKENDFLKLENTRLKMELNTYNNANDDAKQSHSFRSFFRKK